jgi:hypothetical protein
MFTRTALPNNCITCVHVHEVAHCSICSACRCVSSVFVEQQSPDSVVTINIVDVVICVTQTVYSYLHEPKHLARVHFCRVATNLSNALVAAAAFACVISVD